LVELRGFRNTLSALIGLKEAGANTLAVFVVTKRNLDGFVRVLEVCSALGLKEVIFNRFVPAGLGLKNRDVIGVPSDSELCEALILANRFAISRDMRIYLGVPIKSQPGFFDRLPAITPTSCPVGIGQSRWTVGPDGRVRRCNL
jgi:MoaA/NifB/PqqE/SkfB family radical SAM enzyme